MTVTTRERARIVGAAVWADAAAGHAQNRQTSRQSRRTRTHSATWVPADRLTAGYQMWTRWSGGR
jgi:hypothetical protein